MQENSVPAPRRSRHGFTLFEVAVSAALVASCLVGVLLVFPIGLRAQQQARFQVYAGVKVLEMIDTFANHDHTFPSHQIECQEDGQAMTPRQWPVDLDRMMMTPALGLLPLPDSISRRLDSDGDEIAKILDAGGRLYYPSPAAYDVGYHAHSNGHNVNPLAKERALPPEAQSILFAVVGDAQENALPGHPCLAWPYFAYYPSMAATGDWSHSLWMGAWESVMWVTDGHYWGVPPDAATHFAAMQDLAPSWHYTWYPDGAQVNGVFVHHPYREWISDLDRLNQYIDHAQKLIQATGVVLHGTPPYLLPDPPADLTTKSKPWDRNDRDIYPDPVFLGGLRYLAAAALARTNWHMVQGDSSPGGQSDATYGTWTNPAHPLTQADKDYCRDLQELCMQWARRYASTNPYDWGAPRPLNRPSCYDFPLVEYDLFAPYPLISDAALNGDVSWKITAPVMPTHYARAYSAYSMWAFNWDNRWLIDRSWAKDAGGNLDTSHFNLTAPFSAAERCRDIVCWAVDWKSYEDYESAPSTPWDSSISYIDSKGWLADSEVTQYPPDLCLAFADATRSSIVPAMTNGGDDDPNSARRTSLAYRQSFFGLWGVDRDGNGKFDKGPLPASARMRAVSIGRWHYYDRRLISALRN